MTTLLKPFVSPETYRALLFYLADLVLGIVGFTLLLAAWPTTLLLAITPLVVPLLIGLRAAVAALARAEAWLARELLGVEVRPPARAEHNGFWGSGFNVLKDDAFWKQQVHLLLAWPIALIPLTVFSFALQLITVPVWYRWVDGADVFGRSDVDTFAETLPFAALGLALLVLGVHLLKPLTRISRRLVSSLLAGDASGAVRAPAELRASHLRALAIHAGATVAVGFLLVAIWALTTADYFWPVWALLPLGLILGIHAWVVAVLIDPRIPRLTGGSQALAVEVGVVAMLFGFLVGIWAASTQGYFWPIWPLLGLTAVLIVSATVIFGQREHRIRRLEQSRAGAVDVQETELRRIERDLHDGAQARLVALGMSLGLAEQKLETDPEAVRELLAEARRGAGEALEELRDLARGIRPPILTDRGLEPALEALTARSPVPVTLSVDVPDRPAGAVETAAYFVVAEALANAIKHSHAERVDIRVRRLGEVLLADVVDDGDGRADPSGRGLTGLKQRVEALDGTVRITSPEGGPTTVEAVLPCAS